MAVKSVEYTLPVDSPLLLFCILKVYESQVGTLSALSLLRQTKEKDEHLPKRSMKSIFSARCIRSRSFSWGLLAMRDIFEVSRGTP